MADDADRAQIEIETGVDIARLAGKAAPKLKAMGRCYNCDEPLEVADQIFCDQECGEDFEKRKRASAILGR